MKSWIHSRRFFVHVLSLTAGLLLTLCIAFSFILYYNARKATDTSIMLSETNRTQGLLRQSTNCWRQYISATSAFALMNVAYDNVDVTKDYHARNVLDNMIHSHVTANSYTRNIDVFISGISTSESPLSHDRYLGHFYFFDIFTEAPPKWPYSFDLVTSYNGKFNRVEITVDAFYLSRFLFTFNDMKRMDFLLLPDDTILLSNHHKNLFSNVREVIPDLPTESPDPLSGSLASCGEYYYLLTEADSYGFRMLSLIPKSVYSGQYTTATLHTAMMSVGLLLVALGISIFLTFTFYRPVKKTMDLLQTYVPQELHAYENEIQFIHRNIKNTMGRANTETVPGAFARIQSAQAAVLQHQINSHFLFNTLETIKAISIAELGAENEIESSIILLNNLIYEGMFQKNLLVRLSYEIQLARCYLDLMLIRYPDVQVEWTVDESLLQCQVFKFTLQPILENCFSHAFKGNLPRQKAIDIRVCREEDDLSIRISDNGVGINWDEYDHLVQALAAPGEPDGARHVGVRNIHQRITDTFGHRYGIRISDVSPGLCVEIRYPIVGGM